MQEKVIVPRKTMDYERRSQSKRYSIFLQTKQNKTMPDRKAIHISIE